MKNRFWDVIKPQGNPNTQEFAEVLKSEPEKAYDYISDNSYKMEKDDLVNILKEVLYEMSKGCYHPQHEQIMGYIASSLDEEYDEEYREYSLYYNGK